MSHEHLRLLASGWQRQTTIDEPRLSELAENYRALGYAVHIAREGDAVADGCGECFKQRQGCTLGTLYIRPEDRPDASAAMNEDELF